MCSNFWQRSRKYFHRQLVLDFFWICKKTYFLFYSKDAILELATTNIRLKHQGKYAVHNLWSHLTLHKQYHVIHNYHLLSTVMRLFRKLLKFSYKYPIVRGIGSYALICPSGCLIQQSYEGKSLKNYDWNRVFRFSVYGVIVVAPMIHGWVRISSFIWPRDTLINSIKKVNWIYPFIIIFIINSFWRQS